MKVNMTYWKNTSQAIDCGLEGVCPFGDVSLSIMNM